MAEIRVENLRKEFSGFTAVQNSLRRFSTRISAMAHSGNFETTMNITVPISMVMNEYE